MRRSFILMLVLSCALVSCGTAGQYADNYRYQDGIYYRGVPAGEEVALAENESGKQFNDKIKVQYDEYGWSSAKTYSSIILVPMVGWPYGYSSWYWGNPWYYYRDPWYYGSPWYWDSWYWDSWYWNDWYYMPYWHYDHYYYHPHYHPHYHGYYKSTTYTPHAGVSMRQSPNSTRVRTSSATRGTSSASYNNGRTNSSTYRRTPSTTNGSSSSYRRSTPSRSSSSSTPSYNGGSSRGSSFNSSGSSSSRSSGGSFRSSGGGSSHSGGGVSRGRR